MKFFSGAIVVFLVVLGLSGCEQSRPSDIRAETFDMLETIRTDKKQVISNLLNDLHVKTSTAGDDEFLMSLYFAYHDAVQDEKINFENFTDRSFDLDRHYVQNYGSFYDILFIDKSGLIFQSVKMESDFGKNIFEGELGRTTLAKTLTQDPDVQFIDYAYYSPSKEAASFFILPVSDNNTHTGWIAFQFSVNAFNSILVDYENLRRTGEVYLTNADKMMLSQSRFLPENSTLGVEVNTEAVRTSLEKNSGNMILADYRGVSVFSSFEKMSFLGVTWIIVAEIDEDEVITDHLMDNLDFYMEQIAPNWTIGADHTSGQAATDLLETRVDINEFAMTKGDSNLVTYGVATCTGVIIRQSDGFSYLGHIYPLDQTYRSGWDNALMEIGAKLSGRNEFIGKRDLLGGMIGRIKNFDVVPADLNKLKITLIATHTDGFPHIIKGLLSQGIFASQIRILYNPDATYANITVIGDAVENIVEWKDENDSRWSTDWGNHDLGYWVKNASGYI